MKIYKKNYLESLLPREPYLSKIQNVEIIISPFINHGNKFRYIDFENPINAHQFKPKYYLNSNNSLICYCATITIAKHVQKAWNLYSINFKPLKTKIKMNKKYLKTNTYDLYSPLIDILLVNKPIHERVIMGKIESINAFLKMLIIKNDLNFSIPKLKNLYIELEKHRLKHNLLTVQNSQIFTDYLGKKNYEKLKLYFNINTTNSIWVGNYLGIENVTYKNKKFTIINLPWGQDLAFAITKKLLIKSKKIRKFIIVGGAGSVEDNLNVDDILIANSVQNEEGEKIEFNNQFLRILPTGKNITSPTGLFSKKIGGGRFLCVNSSLGHKKNFSQTNKNNGIKGFDMESYGILKAIKETKPKTKIFMIHYIMDLPLKGLELGATYYNKNFLNKLLSNFNRGKYFCFDFIFELI